MPHPRTIITLAAILLSAGCLQEPPQTERYRAQAALAIAEAEQPSPKRQTQPDAQPLQKPDEKIRRILYFGANSCPACRQAKQSLDKLADAGWQVGPGSHNHIQTVTIDGKEENHEFARQLGVNSVPTWIVWKHGRELERRTGPLDPFEVGRLFDE